MCSEYEGTTNELSEIKDDCPLTVEDTTQDIYNQLEEINLNLLGEKCLTYVLTAEGKTVVKNVLLKHEEKICELQDRIKELEDRPLCDMLLGDCVDTKCLEDPCLTTILTVGQLLQALVNKACNEI
jgi:BMFP domain-containing protein YqiC